MTTNGDKWLHKGNHSTADSGHLINIEPLKKIIECALISPYIKNEKPLSLLIVAKAESGKTTAMKMYGQLITEYPNSPWKELAEARSKLLDWYQKDEPHKLIAEHKR